jgi:hypothetical protein
MIIAITDGRKAALFATLTTSKATIDDDMQATSDDDTQAVISSKFAILMKSRL